ncbi:MAG: TIGR02757 family protein [Melioribacteraceae bacterium]
MNSLKSKLEYHYKKFDYSQIYPDPLIFPHRFKNELDIEISAFVSSVFAYGNVKQIMNTLEKLHDLFGESPSEFVKSFSKIEHREIFKTFKHRFYTGDDTIILFETLKNIIENYESIKKLFLLHYSQEDTNVKKSLSFFSQNLKRISKSDSNKNRGVAFMFPDPLQGSACKRMNLFLRWMVRKDELDFGLWQEIRKDQLVIPVDTHVAKVSTHLGLTKRKNVSWQMAEEITENLKQFDKNDPVKYDFAICHLGMRKLKF